MAAEQSKLASRTAIVNVFESFRNELDEHNDRRERLIKSSRDVTNLSKKVIFLLHRIMTEDAAPEEQDDRARALCAASRAKEKLKDIQQMFAAFKDEVRGDRFWRYQHNVSPGLQEYIEALSFAHYLETDKLISFDEVQRTLSDEEGNPYFPLPLEDYLLGLSDLTGELMRYAISSISRRGGRLKANEVCTFVRGCRADFEAYTPYFRDLRKKQNVTTQSLEKIEDAAYAIAVRSSEYDLPPEILDDLVSRFVSGTHGGDSDGGRKKRPREGEEDDMEYD
ncbi:Translin [Panus rudis PR-1116 ss-1]|nr:Translin [Panus rudis PR-1116 ss-1]